MAVATRPAARNADPNSFANVDCVRIHHIDIDWATDFVARVLRGYVALHMTSELSFQWSHWRFQPAQLMVPCGVGGGPRSYGRDNGRGVGHQSFAHHRRDAGPAGY